MVVPDGRYFRIVVIGSVLGMIFFEVISQMNNFKLKIPNGKYEMAGRMILMCRTFGGEYSVLKLTLMNSLNVFWNANRFGRLIIVLDDENPDDHILGNSLERECDWVTVKYEKPMPHVYHNHGKTRSQWSNFWSDNYTNMEYIGIIDTDSLLVTLPTESDFFRNGKPIIQGRLGIGGGAWWQKIPHGTQWALGFPEMARCMNYFPVIMKRKHFIMLRAHICKNANRTDFDQVFRKFSKPDLYSQFNIFCNYLWQFHRDEYEWRFQEDPPGWIKSGHKGVAIGQVNNYTHVNENNTRPLVKPFIHYHYHTDEFGRLHQNNYITQGYCFVTNYSDPVICNRSIPLHRSSLHKTMFRFDYGDWLYDLPGCMRAHEYHYTDVTRDIQANLWNMSYIENFIYNLNLKVKYS